jgi:HNH endonuclease
MKTIELTNGQLAKVDDENYDHLSKFTWRLNKQGYVVASIRVNYVTINFKMAHEVLGKPPKGKEIHHINRDRLDNQKSNLEILTILLHRHKQPLNNITGYRNVTFGTHKTLPFKARVTKGKISYYLGAFSTPEEAARAADKKAVELYGQEATLNFPNANH